MPELKFGKKRGCFACEATGQVDRGLWTEAECPQCEGTGEVELSPLWEVFFNKDSFPCDLAEISASVGRMQYLRRRYAVSGLKSRHCVSKYEYEAGADPEWLGRFLQELREFVNMLPDLR